MAEDNFTPFGEKVIKRDYTQDMIKADIGEPSVNEIESDIPEPIYEKPNFEDNPDDSTGNSSGSTNSSSQSAEKQSMNPKLDDLSDRQKRKAARETADALITAYARFVPMPFVSFSSYNMNKMNRLDVSGEISLNMVVTENGTTVESYMNDFNRQVEDTFKVTDEMKDEIREPLIDVLMEQQLALTPFQRLMMVVGGHFVQLGVSTAQLIVSKKQTLEVFKEFKKAEGNSSRFTRPQPQPQEQPQPQPQPQSNNQTDEDIQDNSSKNKETTKKSSYEKPTFDMDDYIEDKVEVVDGSDDGITIEEIENE